MKNNNNLKAIDVKCMVNEYIIRYDDILKRMFELLGVDIDNLKSTDKDDLEALGIDDSNIELLEECSVLMKGNTDLLSSMAEVIYNLDTRLRKLEKEDE